MATTVATTTSELRCARHPNTPTMLRCGRCDTPICPKCMTNTSVGQRCPSCAKGSALPTFQVSPSIVLRGLGAGLLTATAIGYLWAFFPFLSFWAGLLLGFATGEAVARAANMKRGPIMMAVGAGSVIGGFIIGFLIFGQGVGANGLFALLVNPLLLSRLGLFTLLGLGIAIVISAVRQRGF